MRGTDDRSHDRPTRPDDSTDRMGRRRFVIDFHQPAPPEDVFPLLCPTREYEWIDYWQCRLLYTETGFAEADCVFSTELESHETWVVTRYEPPEHIDFCIFTDAEVVVQLKIAVSRRDDGQADLRWERTYTSTGPSGRDRVQELTAAEVEGRMRDVNERLAYYLERGDMLRSVRFGNGS